MINIHSENMPDMSKDEIAKTKSLNGTKPQAETTLYNSLREEEKKPSNISGYCSINTSKRGIYQTTGTSD